MAITPLPTPPSRNDPTNFAARGDAFLGALPAFATEANALAVQANADAVTAASAAAAATAALNITKWISGTTYAEGVVVWSPISYLSYRRKSAGAGTTDPSADSTNWALASGMGNVLSSAAVFTGSITEQIFALGTSGTLALNPSNGTVQTCALTGNATFTESLTSGQSLVLMLTNGESYTVTFPTTTWVTSTGNIAPILTAADSLVFWKISTTLFGAVVGNYV